MTANSCGCVMEMDIDAEMKATKARMLVCGKASTASPIPAAGSFKDSCDVNGIANPDNVAVIPKAKQVPPQFPPRRSRLDPFRMMLIDCAGACLLRGSSSSARTPVRTSQTSSGFMISTPRL
jgi:hypothetical protein